MRKIRTTALTATVACAVLAALFSSVGAAPKASAAPSAPSATTGSASGVAQSSATVGATVNPAGTDTHYYFQYGTTSSYGFNTTSTDAGAGTNDVPESAKLSGLAPSTTYHYRIVAVSSAGTTNGDDKTFTTTTPPTATTTAPSTVTRTSATLTGKVDPNGQATTYYFRYGTSTAYGTQSAPASAGAGNGPVGIHTTVFGLSPKTTYHYQLVAQNAGGTSYGADQTLTTTSSEAAVLGHEGFVSPGRVVGVELGCFHGTATCKGHLTMSHGKTLIAQRDYSIRADSGGFQNMKLTSTGMAMLHSNHVWHLLPVTVTATGDTGQKLSFTIHLARWIWH